MRESIWYGCYDDGWQGLIVPDAFSHPAKYAKGLIYRIVRHGLEMAYWRKDECILDCFAGVGLGALPVTAAGMKFIGVEIEEKFIFLARANFALHKGDWRAMNRPLPVVLQGDSRRLKDVLGQAMVDGGITSPPYIDSRINPIVESDIRKRWNKGISLVNKEWDGYGTTPGQIGAMAEGVHGITSPPFGQPEGRDRYPVQDGSVSDTIKRAYTEDKQAQHPDNIARFPIHGITSPPYANRVDDHGTDQPGYDMVRKMGKYGDSEGQLGNVHGVTSPPYIDSPINPGNVGNEIKKRWGKGIGLANGAKDGYGATPGQIGAMPEGRPSSEPNDYWGAVAQVYQQLYDVMSPGGVLAVVLKSFVRDKKLVDLPAMTRELLEGIGFTTIEVTKAMLTAEAGQATQDGGVKIKERKSFFRRLAEAKGSPRVDYEVVLWVRK